MNVVCPHCHETIELTTCENQTIAGCHKCNGTFKIEMLNPSSNKSSIVPEPDEIKVLCPFCFRKVLMPETMMGDKITCPDCGNDYTVEPKNVIFTIPDKRVATGSQLKDPVRLEKAPTETVTLAPKSDAVQIRPKAKKVFKK